MGEADDQACLRFRRAVGGNSGEDVHLLLFPLAEVSVRKGGLSATPTGEGMRAAVRRQTAKPVLSRQTHRWGSEERAFGKGRRLMLLAPASRAGLRPRGPGSFQRRFRAAGASAGILAGLPVAGRRSARSRCAAD